MEGLFDLIVDFLSGVGVSVDLRLQSISEGKPVLTCEARKNRYALPFRGGLEKIERAATNAWIIYHTTGLCPAFDADVVRELAFNEWIRFENPAVLDHRNAAAGRFIEMGAVDARGIATRIKMWPVPLRGASAAAAQPKPERERMFEFFFGKSP